MTTVSENVPMKTTQQKHYLLFGGFNFLCKNQAYWNLRIVSNEVEDFSL